MADSVVQQVEQQRYNLKKTPEAYTETNVTLLEIIGGQATLDGKALTKDETASIIAQAKPAVGFGSVLIGQDGRVRHRANFAVNGKLIHEWVRDLIEQERAADATTKPAR